MQERIARHCCEHAASVPGLRTVGGAAAAGRGHAAHGAPGPLVLVGNEIGLSLIPLGAMTAGPPGGLAIETPGVDVALGGVEVLHGIGTELAAGAGGTERRLSRCGSAVRLWPRCPTVNGRGQLSWLERARSD